MGSRILELSKDKNILKEKAFISDLPDISLCFEYYNWKTEFSFFFRVDELVIFPLLCSFLEWEQENGKGGPVYHQGMEKVLSNLGRKFIL